MSPLLWISLEERAGRGGAFSCRKSSAPLWLPWKSSVMGSRQGYPHQSAEDDVGKIVSPAAFPSTLRPRLCVRFLLFFAPATKRPTGASKAHDTHGVIASSPRDHPPLPASLGRKRSAAQSAW